MPAAPVHTRGLGVPMFNDRRLADALMISSPACAAPTSRHETANAPNQRPTKLVRMSHNCYEMCRVREYEMHVTVTTARFGRGEVGNTASVHAEIVTELATPSPAMVNALMVYGAIDMTSVASNTPSAPRAGVGCSCASPSPRVCRRIVHSSGIESCRPRATRCDRVPTSLSRARASG